MQSLFKNFITKTTVLEQEPVPLNRLDRTAESREKLPWIVKKTVLVDENGREVEKPVRRPVKVKFEPEKDKKKPNILPEAVIHHADDGLSIDVSSMNPFDFHPDSDGDFSDGFEDDFFANEKSSTFAEEHAERFTRKIAECFPETDSAADNGLSAVSSSFSDEDNVYIEKKTVPEITAESYHSDITAPDREQSAPESNHETFSSDNDFPAEKIRTNRLKMVEEAVAELADDDIDDLECIDDAYNADDVDDADYTDEIESTVSLQNLGKDKLPAREPEKNSGKTLYQVEKERQQKALEEKKKEKVFGEIEINKEYIVPMHFLNMTSESNEESWQNEIRRNSHLLIKTLGDFGIEAKVVKVNRGPVITLYEMQIAPGIKVNRIVSLSDDIAMALAASRVRVVAPIPGKSAIGVEVPNHHRESVTLGDILNSEEYTACNMVLKVALGKDILGKPVMLDLKKQPHLLIAGATGAGKSVLVNTIISSLVYGYNPSLVRFIMVDPKMVELQLYNGMPHQLCEVITDPDLSPRALKWAILEMERRYRLLSEHGVRDIERFNQKMDSHRRREEMEKLPYIVIIIDELADLMMVAPKEIENYITRIAQKARAVGIHLIIATQRPSVDVITGVIKANFPARIAFQVAQKNDSRTIIDQNGAEKLLGKGDMLYQSPMSSFPVRIQGAYISEDEIEQIVVHAKSFGRPQYIDIEETINEYDELTAGSGEDEDDLFVEALQIIEETRKASASYLQRRLSIGYNRAARIIERMEELGYIGAAQGSKPREILI